jgi:nucleoside-diphosphate-sugar epimerase
LLAARDEKVTKFIYSGSSTYYGSQETPHHEFNTPMQFLNAYALSKYVGEQYCLLFDKIYALPCTILRYFNVYGPRQPEVGAYALVLGIFLNRFAKGEPLEIHGDGSQRRDFIHVSDVASANLAAWESPLHGEVFNVGSGVNISIQELADQISNNQIYGERRKADAAHTLADITRIQALLGWRPTISFEEGLASMMPR